jgi:cation transporter-like permease
MKNHNSSAANRETHELLEMDFSDSKSGRLHSGDMDDDAFLELELDNTFGMNNSSLGLHHNSDEVEIESIGNNWMPELDFIEEILLDDSLTKEQILHKLSLRLDNLSLNNHAATMNEMPFYLIALHRSPAILATLLLEFTVSMVITSYSKLIQRYILISAFLPLLSAIAGNLGLQSSTATLRGLSTGHIIPNYDSILKTLRREFLSSLSIAVWSGTIIFFFAFIWSGEDVRFGLVTGTAVLLNCSLAGLLGTLGPLTFKYLEVDPALLAGPFETALQDVVGTSLYLSMMSYFLL